MLKTFLLKLAQIQTKHPFSRSKQHIHSSNQISCHANKSLLSVIDLPDSVLPQQIQVELHWGTRMTGVPWMPRLRSSGELALLTGMMFTGGGYMPILRQYVLPWCPACLEVLYFRVAC